MSDWKSYSNKRLIKSAVGFFIIKPEEDSQILLPLACPNCNLLLSSSDDATVFIKFKCCSWCADKWAYINSDRWRSGWRPSREDVNSQLNKRVVKSLVI